MTNTAPQLPQPAEPDDTAYLTAGPLAPGPPDPATKVRDTARLIALRRADQPARFLLLVRSEFELPAGLAKANETAKRDTLRQLTDVVDQGVAGGQFRSVDARTSALAIIGMCNWVAGWHHPNIGQPSGDVADQLADLAVAMVSRHDGSGPHEPGPAAALALVRENLDYLERTIRPLTDPLARDAAEPPGCSRKQARTEAAGLFPERARTERVVVSAPGIAFELLDGAQAAAHEDELQTLHAEVFADPPYRRTADAGRFARRLRVWRRQPGFALALARHGGFLVGYAAGMPLRPSTSWWRELTTPAPEDLTAEHPGRTFALTELLVRGSWRRQGIGGELHDLILTGRPEERATLTVLPAAGPAQAAFRALGWQKVARTRGEEPDSAVSDVLVIALPAIKARAAGW